MWVGRKITSRWTCFGFLTSQFSFHSTTLPSVFFLCLPFIRVPSGFQSRILHGSLYRGILFTCPKYRKLFYSITVRAVNKQINKLSIMFCYTVTWRLQDKLKLRSLLGCCAVQIGSEQQTFRDNLFHLKRSSIPLLDPWKLGRQVVPKRR